MTSPETIMQIMVDAEQLSKAKREHERVSPSEAERHERLRLLRAMLERRAVCA